MPSFMSVGASEESDVFTRCSLLFLLAYHQPVNPFPTPCGTLPCWPALPLSDGIISSFPFSPTIETSHSLSPNPFF